MTKTPNHKNAVKNAFALIGKPVNKDSTESAILPTARARKGIDFLSRTTPQEMKEAETPLRPLLQDLFNWDGGNHVNKPLIRAFETAINTPMKYPQAVELTGFLSALAPLLQADQIARMYGLINNVSTAFAPAKYTIQLHGLLESVFKDFSPERRERLASSLWEESHQGRWWNLSAGIGIDDHEAMQNVEYEPRTPEEIFTTIRETFNSKERFNNNVHIEWNPHYHEVFSQHPLSSEVASLAEDYRDKLEVGEFVHPDIAVYLSNLPWLAPWQRPESPIGGLLKELLNILEHMEEVPDVKKPRKFSELFPGIHLQAGAFDGFPLFPPLRSMEGKEVGGGKVSIIKNKVALAQNAKYMGNCTRSYENQMENGKYALLFLDTGEQQYNISVISAQRGWRVQELNTRYNRGAGNPQIRRSIETMIQGIPSLTEEHKRAVEALNRIKDGEQPNRTYSYSLY